MPLIDDFIADEEESPAVAEAPPPIIPPPESFGYSAYIPRAPVVAPPAWQPYGQYVTDRGQIENRIAFDPSKGLAPLSKLALTPEEAQAGMEAVVAPFLPEKDRQALMESPLAPGPLAKATAGFTQGAANTAESLTSPINLGLMVGTAGLSKIPMAARALSGAFAADMGRHVPEMARNLGEAVASKDPEAIAKAATELAATGAFTTAAGTHAVGPRPAPGVMLPETLRELSREPSTPRPNALPEPGRTATPDIETPKVPEVGESTAAPTATPKEAPLTEAPSLLPEQFRTKPVAETTDLVNGVTSEELGAYRGTAGGGATGFMWDLGARAKTAADVAALRKMGEEASAQTKALMDSGDMMGAMKVIGRQPAEAFEYATGVKLDGTPKWTTFEQMAARKGRTYKPSVPDPQYVKAKGGEPVETQIQKGPEEVLDQGKAVAEPALGEAAAAPAAAALKQLPPVPAGHVRLFHGEGGPQGGGTGGAFYTSNIAKASTFGPDVSWVDLPTDKATAAFAKAKASAFAGGDNFILEAADISRSKKINQKVEPPTHVLDEPPAPPAASPAPAAPPAPQRGTQGIAASARRPGALRGDEAGVISMAPVQAAVDAFKTKALQQLPRLPDVSREPLPDLGIRNDNKKIATEPTGFGRTPVLGWLLDPRQKATLPHEKAILTWFYEKAVGDAHVQALSSTFGNRFKNLFPRNAAGELSNVGTTRPGQSRHPSDVFEGLQRDPNSYVLTPEQRAGFTELMKHEQKLRRLAKKYKIRLDEEAGEFVDGAEGQTPYWTRGRTLKRGAETRPVGGTMVGARQYFQKGRSFKTEAEGVSKGFEYPLNIEDRLIMRAERLYKAIADRRLAQDKDIGGRWGGTPTYEEAQVFQPAFRREFTMETPEGPQHVSQSKIFPIKTANALNKAFGNQSSTIRKSVASANNFLKSLTLGFDFGVGQIQLLGTAYKNPGLWGKANWTAMKAFLSRDVFAKYAEQNAEPIRELAQYGSGVGRLPEMMAGLESGELMTAGPRALGKAIERAGAPRTGKAVAATAEVPAAFARQFQTFMDVAKVELWKARREAVPREEWAREVQAIESQLLSSNMERIGVTPNRALVERMLLLAPSYYRGALNQIGGLAANGASGQTYRRAMGAYMLGTTATFVGLALAAGLSWDDIRKRLNPERGDFMMVPVKTGNRTIEVGFGGIMRSFMRLGGEIVETSSEHPGNWKSLAPDKNPITRWLRGHAAPVPAKAWDAFSGKDYMGEEADLASVGKGSLPLAAQQLFGEKTPRTPGGVALETATQFLGGSSFPGKTTKQKVGSMYQEWREKQTDPKVKADIKRREGLVLPEGKYKALDDALSVRDEAGAIKAIGALKAEGQKNRDILDRMRPFTGEGINSRTKRLFQGEPPQFKASLKPEQREEYQKALEERKATYQEFLKAWRKRDTAQKTGPAIDFVPDAGQ